MVLARLLLAGVLGLASTSATTGSTSQSTRTITVVPGDTMAVQGSDIDCGVPTTAPPAVICAIVTHGALRPNSYATRSAQAADEIVRATGDHRVVFRASNPKIKGLPFGITDRTSANFTLAKHEYVVLEGTNVVCQSGLAKTGGAETFGCGAYSSSSLSSGYYLAGTFATTISDQNAAILRVGKAGAESLVAFEKQP
jgi:hypothetical protein